MQHPMDMTGRRILVTGASAGIGRETARFLSRLGAEVVCVGRSAERLQETLGELEGTGHAAEEFDLSTGDAIVPWLRDLAGRRGPLSGLAHCAGIQKLGAVRTMNAALLDEMYRTNAVSAALLVRAFQLPGCAVPDSSIVLVSSAAAVIGLPANGAYAASKGALLAMVRTFAMELVKSRIRVNAVVPGLVETGMAQRSRDAVPPEAFDRLVQNHPLGIGRPEDVAYAIAFLLAPTGRWITGSSLVVDGGLTVA